MAATLRIRDVVTAFLWDGRRVLLARRSGQVSTFPEHWAGISGYIEAEPPLKRAVLEIVEECGLAPWQVVLLRRGKPLEVAAPEIETTFRVHPFLFRCLAAEAIAHDWEAHELRWVDPQVLLRDELHPTVPQLRETLQRVWPPQADPDAVDLQAALAADTLRDDRQHGAGELARWAVGFWRGLCELLPAVLGPPDARRLEDAALRLAASRRSMVAIANCMDDCLATLRRCMAEAGGSPPSPQALVKAAGALLEKLQADELAAAHHAAACLPQGGCIVTLGYSGTVRAALLAARDRLRQVLVCEGRPACEGRWLATQLAAEGIAVCLLTDAQAFQALPQSDGVLLGADAVLHDGSVVNKSGSALLALAARYFSKPVWVAAARIKFARDAQAGYDPEPHAACEVWPDAPSGVEVRNCYFDCIPAALVASLVDEHGVHASQRVSGTGASGH
jgi:translation initiation factor 2B subunit (eIF-2B alpha/beta/delta family)